MNFKITQLLLLCGFISCNGQKPFGTEQLSLKKTIEMPGVNGRIDHMAINLKENIVYVAALGNNTVEVIDLDKAALIHSIKGLDEPQGICWLADRNEIVVANGGNGTCIFYNASTYAIIATVNLGDDADNIRYDAAGGKVFVGYGGGGIAVIDAVTHKLVNDIKLPAHPESLQLDQKNDLLFVNLPDRSQIAIIDLKNLKLVNSWKIDDLHANFPMTLDTAANRVIVGYRHPAMLVSYDITTGQEQSRTKLVSDVDDIFFYEKEQEVFASGGGGAINIFRRENNKSFKLVANIPTRSGARTSLLIPSSQTFLLAERAAAGKPAAVVVYQINK